MNESDIAEQFQKFTHKEHIEKLPDTYIGSIDLTESLVYVPIEQSVLNIENSENSNAEGNVVEDNVVEDNVVEDNLVENNVVENNLVEDNLVEDNLVEDNVVEEKQDDNQIRMVKRSIKHIPGLCNIVDEIIVNAFDQYSRTNKEKNEQKLKKPKNRKKRIQVVKTIKIWVNEDENSITVYNDGDGIDVAIHPTENVYVPQMIFGELLTSSNYNQNEEKVTGGKNGYGAKLTNIFSSFFSIETVDHRRKKRFYQEYTNNMNNKTEPLIEDVSKNKKPYTQIKFIPDFNKFNCDGLSQDMILFIKKRAYDMAACSAGKLNIYYNGQKLDVDTFDQYVALYTGPNSEDKRVCQVINDRWAIGAIMSPEQTFAQVSFVNGISTIRGGKHVDYITRQLTSKIAAYIKKKKRIDVRETYIKENLMVFVNSIIVNPSFDSQTKETLTTSKSKFGSTCKIDQSFIEKLANTGIMEKAIALDQFKDSQGLKKTDGKKVKSILDIPKLDDAKWAGTRKSNQCCLILTEGDSAKAMAVAGISVLEDGRNKYGIFPLRGKLLNVRDKSDKDLSSNAEIINIKRILGLQEGREYLNISSLRYGKLMIMTDQDVDGSHIKGLIVNFLCRWPSLMKLNGFITSLITPIVKVKKARNVISFYTLTDYEEWQRNNNNGRGWTTKYYKGLGTSTPKEAKEYFREFKVIEYHWDDLCEDTIDMAFNKGRSDDRKTWLSQYNRNSILNLNQSWVTMSDFINSDLIHFSVADCQRSIPNLCDGLKPSQRKILYCAEKRNLKKEIRVAQLAGYVSEHGAYHHGEASLQGTIIGMAQNYVGSRNINLLEPVGQFGSRLEGGKDSAQPRYINTFLTNLTGIIYNKLDNPLYQYIDDDGLTVEPEYYVPIIPMVLVNGTEGIGTGWSSNIPQFNPLDIINNLKKLMEGKEPDEMIPWYRGFTGEIIKISENRWLSKGTYKIIGDNQIEITELPVGVWINNYKRFLDDMVAGLSGSIRNSNLRNKLKNKSRGRKSRKDKELEVLNKKEIPKYLKDYKNNSSESSVNFVLEFENGMLYKLLETALDKNGINQFEKVFKLTSSISCERTQNVYNKDGKIVNYTNHLDILKDYYQVRLHYYQLRKKYMIDKMEKELQLLSVKVRFILDVINQKILINNKSKANVTKQLEKHKYPKMVDNCLVELTELKKMSKLEQNSASYDYLIRMPIYNLTKEKIEELKNERDLKSSELELLKSKSEIELWTSDLIVFRQSYKKFMKAYYEYMGHNYAEITKQKRKPRKKIQLSLTKRKRKRKVKKQKC